MYKYLPNYTPSFNDTKTSALWNTWFNTIYLCPIKDVPISERHPATARWSSKFLHIGKMLSSTLEVLLTKFLFTLLLPCLLVSYTKRATSLSVSSSSNNSNDFFIIKPNRRTNFTDLFWHETLHVSDSSSVHNQEFIHCTLSSVICPYWSCSNAIYKLVWHNIAECTVNKIPMMDRRLSETYRVSCQNKFVNLVHLFGFIIKQFVTMHGHMNVKS